MNVDHGMLEAQFENVNSLRNYPFAEGESIVDRYGRELPKDVIVDLHIVAPCSAANPQEGFVPSEAPDIRLSSVHISKYMLSACFVARRGPDQCALSVSVSAESFMPYFPYRLEKLAGTNDAGGIVTFGNLEFPGFPETYFFKDRFAGDSGVAVHPCCIASTKPSGVRRLIDRRSGESISGDVEIGFSGYVLSRSDGKRFNLYLDKGADSELASECAKISGSDACGATPISTINGIRPDDDGNIVIWFH